MSQATNVLLSRRVITEESAQYLARHAKAILFIITMLLVGVVYYRVPIRDHFTGLWADHLDGGIETAIFEHWYNVVRGYSHWSTTNYFYPDKDGIGYNEGFFLYGLIYSIFRSLGYDMFVSGMLMDMAVKAIGFISFYLFVRDSLSFRFAYALLGAAIFTLSHAIFMHAFHQQLASVAFAPLIAYLAVRGYGSLTGGRGHSYALFCSAAAALYSGWLLTSFYMAWFFGLFCLAMIIVGLFTAGLPFYRRTVAFLAQFKWHTAATVIVSALSLIPVLLAYLPKAAQTGMHRWADALVFAPAPNDAVNVGTGNFMFGHFFNVFCRFCTVGNYEDMTGMPPIQMYVFLCALVWIVFLCRPPQLPFLRTVAIAAALTWLLLFRFGRFSGWEIIFYLVPGAKAVRVLGRYQDFLTFPVVVVSMAYFQAISARMPRTMVVLVSTLMLLEQLGTSPAVGNRADTLARIDAPPPPPACKSFFTTAAKGQDASSPLMTLYPHNVEAMLIAERLHIPTINGYATFLPPGWNFEGPTRPDYIQRVLAYAHSHNLRGLCQLNLQTLHWSGPIT